MNVRLLRLFSVLGYLIVLANVTAFAQDRETELTFASGAEFTNGSYGGDVDIEDLYVPFTATINYGRVEYRLSVPYLSVRAPEGTVIIDGEPVPGIGDLSTESGLGDVIASATVFDVINNQRLGFAMDLTGKVKFGTADEDKGLGTGKNDYSVQADFYKFSNQVTLLGSVGYKFRGDPAAADLNNVLMGSVGAIYKFTPALRSGLIFDFREASANDSDSVQELTGFVSRRIGENWRLQVFAMTGFTDSSPDWGGGIQIKRILYR